MQARTTCRAASLRRLAAMGGRGDVSVKQRWWSSVRQFLGWSGVAVKGKLTVNGQSCCGRSSRAQGAPAAAVGAEAPASLRQDGLR